MLRRLLRPHVLNAYLGPGLLGWQRRLRRWGRRQFDLFLQVDDPYSLLLAQAIGPIAAAAGADVVPQFIGRPHGDFTPDVERLEAWALRDGALLAREWGLRFPEEPRRPQPGEILAAMRDVSDVETFVDVSMRLLGGGYEGQEGDSVLVSSADEALLRMGHYQGGMLHYEGEWTWGVDRLWVLEERLRGEGVSVPERERPAVAMSAEEGDPPLEFFFSFRSPYSYLAIDPVLRLVEETGVPLVIRPVLPMVMRGLSVPRAKVLYIARDCARLARRQGTPFGRIADPLGPGIERCLALFVAAGEEERGPLLASIGRGAWSEGLDVTHEPHLRAMVERAGTTWPGELDVAAGLELAEANRQALLELGLWGVPSFRYGGFTAWGQDRIGRLERVIRVGQPS